MDAMGSIRFPVSSQPYGDVKINLPGKGIESPVSLPGIEDGFTGTMPVGSTLPEIKDTVGEKPALTGVSDDKLVSAQNDAPKAEVFTPAQKEKPVSAFEGFFLAGGMESQPGFGEFSLNGPSSLTQGIVTLKGMNTNNPTSLFME